MTGDVDGPRTLLELRQKPADLLSLLRPQHDQSQGNRENITIAVQQQKKTQPDNQHISAFIRVGCAFIRG